VKAAALKVKNKVLKKSVLLIVEEKLDSLLVYDYKSINVFEGCWLEIH
jgi:hypothetical protein